MGFPGRKCCLAVDILPVTLDWKYIGLIMRAHHPEMGKLVLAGGHVDADNRECTLLPEKDRCPPDPSVPFAVVREGGEELSIIFAIEELIEWEWLDAVGRDPREDEEGEDRRVSKAFLAFVTEEQRADAKARSDALELHWVELDSITEDMIGFDHFRAIKKLQDENQRRREFWDKLGSNLYSHQCKPMIKAQLDVEYDLEDSDATYNIKVLWEVFPSDSAFLEICEEGLPIVACPFCGHKIHPPIED